MVKVGDYLNDKNKQTPKSGISFYIKVVAITFKITGICNGTF